jgi:hypothetical protein
MYILIAVGISILIYLYLLKESFNDFEKFFEEKKKDFLE